MEPEIVAQETPQKAKKAPPALILNGDSFPVPNVPVGLRKALERPKGFQTHEYDIPLTIEYICELLACGKSLVSICKLEGMPTYSTVMKWINDDSDLAESYERARQVQADYLAEETIEIADNCREGVKITVKSGAKGTVTERVTADLVERTRLMIDARKWYAAKLAPKKYGDRLQTDLNVQVETHEQRLARLVGGGGS